MFAIKPEFVNEDNTLKSPDQLEGELLEIYRDIETIFA